MLRFEEGSSFTGEDVVEFQVHGGPAVQAAVLSAVLEIEECRLAEPGEFTHRALAHGVLDLVAVEGLADLIDAETSEQHRQALHMASGAVSEKVEAWRQTLVRGLALIEASIDFADEELPASVAKDAARSIRAGRDALAGELANWGAQERLRDGFEVAIVGAPNAGKSTLLNALAGREAAITSDVAGTTRDVIEVRMDCLGLPVTFLDTAGLRETDDTVERIGVERARARAGACDLRVFVLAEGQSVAELGVSLEKDDVIAQSFADVREVREGLAVSGLTGEGIGLLVERVHGALSSRLPTGATIGRERHRRNVAAAVDHLDLALQYLSLEDVPFELVAESTRLGVGALDSLLGRVDVEDLLDEIFGSFCIGK